MGLYMLINETTSISPKTKGNGYVLSARYDKAYCDVKLTDTQMGVLLSLYTSFLEENAKVKGEQECSK